jgi:hypothetical protein
MSRLIAIAILLASTVISAGAEVGIGDEPEVRGWAMVQQGPVVSFEKDLVRGDTIPANIQLVGIPNFPQYGFIILNAERLIVDPETRKVIAVY